MKRHLHLVTTSLLLALTGICLAQTETKAKSPSTGMGKDGFAQMIIEKSRQTWEAYKNRDIATMKAMTGNDYGSYTAAGYSNLQEDIRTINDLKIEAYTIDDPTVTKVAKDVAILRYKCDLKGSMKGKKFKPVYSTEVWVNRGGKWMIVSYQETER